MYRVSRADTKGASHYDDPIDLEDVQHIKLCDPPTVAERDRAWKINLPIYSPQIECKRGTPIAVEDKEAPLHGEATGLYIADFDCKTDAASVGNAEAIVLSLRTMPHVVMAYTSASGKGVHALIAGPKAKTYIEHKRIWRQIIPEFAEGVARPKDYKLDHAGQDINRKLFISPEIDRAVIKEDAVPIEMPTLDPYTDYIPPNVTLAKFTATEVTEILDALPDEYCDDYVQWRDTVMAVKNELNGDGYAVSDAWSRKSEKYGKGKPFSEFWVTISDTVADGITGATLTKHAKQYAPAIYHKWRKRCAAESKVKTNDYGVRCLDETEWQEMIEYVPEIGKLRRKAIEQKKSPTAALFGMCAVVPSMVGWGVRLEGYYSSEPQPLSVNIAVFGLPGKGKSKTLKWCQPPKHRRELREFYIRSRSNPSGQSTTALLKSLIAPNGAGSKILKDHAEAVENAKAARAKKPDDPKLELDIHQYVTKPNILITYDEASIFDNAANSANHGAGLIGFCSASYFGDADDIMQNAATDAANRILPHHTPMSVSMWLNVQPGTAKKLMLDETGFSERFMVVAPSPLEHYTPYKEGDELVEGVQLFEDWEPPSYIQKVPTYPGADMGDVDGAISMVRLSKEAKKLLHLVTSYMDVSGEEGTEEKSKQAAADVGDSKWCNLEGLHSLSIVARYAGCLALYEGESTVTLDHLNAALVMAKYAYANKEGYKKHVGITADDDDVKSAARKERIASIAKDANNKRLLIKWATAAAKKFHKGAFKDGGSKSSSEIIDSYNSTQRVAIKESVCEIDDILAYAVEENWLTELEDGIFSKGPVSIV